ncbi:MAG: hemerythrin family protein [Sedimentisphaerales bacterium]|nr:hemerythrin family protein [Sedimentisphaerales bacterium]
MDKIEWDNGLSVGIELIDEQHKMLIQRLYEVSEAIEMVQGEGAIAKTLDFLIDYANFHFSAEEKCMAEENYPGLDYQKAKHEEFINSLRRFEQDFKEDGATPSLANHIKDFLFNWLIRHIKDVDHKFGEFLNKKES